MFTHMQPLSIEPKCPLANQGAMNKESSFPLDESAYFKVFTEVVKFLDFVV